MELTQRIVADLRVEEEKAEKGVGAILMALRASVDRDAFERVKQALPHSEHLMGRALMGGGRTGEMPALVGPSGLAAALGAAGFGKADIPRLGQIVIEHLRPALGEPALERFLAAVPAFKG